MLFYCHNCAQSFGQKCPTCEFEISIANKNLCSVSSKAYEESHKLQDEIWSSRNQGLDSSIRSLKRYRFNHSYNGTVLKRVLKRHIKPKQTVLDIGFAQNPRLHYLALERRIKAIGIDISYKNCHIQSEISRILGNDSLYICSNALQIPLPSHSIDVVVATDIIEHFNSSERKSLFGEIKRLLKRNGKLILKSPFEKNMPPSLNLLLHTAVPRQFWERNKAAGHYRDNALSKAELLSLLSRNNFQIIAFRHFNFLFDKIYDYYLPALAKSLNKRLKKNKQRNHADIGPGHDSLEPEPELKALMNSDNSNRLHAINLILAIARELMVLPDRLFCSLNWGNHFIAVCTKR